MADYFCDLVGGNDANNGTSFALRKLTISSATSVMSAGDRLKLLGYAPTNTGVNITTTLNSASATLSAAVNKTFDMCEATTNWTAGTGITMTADATTYIQGSKSIKAVVGGTYVNGTKALLFDLGSTQDFSAYEQVCFWILSSVVWAASDWSLVLYSDVGTTVVQTINLPALTSVQWHPIVINTGAALNSTVRSFAFVRNAGASTPTFYVDAIFASKAATAVDCITLHTLVSTQNALTVAGFSNSIWYAVRSVDGTAMTLRHSHSSIIGASGSGLVRVQAETSVALYAQRVQEVTQQTISNSGSVAGGDITISGGWNSTDMSTQVGYTAWFTQYGSTQSCLTGSNRAYITIEKLRLHGSYVSLFSQASGLNVLTATNCSFHALVLGSTTAAHGNWRFTNINMTGWQQGYYNAPNAPCYFKNCLFSGEGATSAGNGGVLYMGSPGVFESCLFTRSGNGINLFGTGGISTPNGHGSIFRNCGTDYNVTCSVAHTGWEAYFDNCLFGDSTEVSSSGGMALGLRSNNHDQTVGNHQIFFNGGKIISDATTRHTASGIAWKFSPTSTSRNSIWPLFMKIATVYCVAGTQVTVSAYFAKDHANISVGLRIIGGQLGGPASDTTQLSTCGTGSTYESTATQIQWTPTSTGWVEIEAICYTSASTTSNGWVDDFGCVYG